MPRHASGSMRLLTLSSLLALLCLSGCGGSGYGDLGEVLSSGPNGTLTYSLAFFPDGQTLAVAGLTHLDRNLNTGSSNPASRIGGFVSYHDARQGKLVGVSYYDHENLTLAISPDGHWVAGGDAAGNLWVWDERSQRRQWNYKIHNSQTNSVAFSPTNNLLASAGYDDKTFQVRNVLDGSRIYTIPTIGQALAVAFSPDGGLLAGASGSTIFLYRTVSGDMVWTLGGHTGNIYTLAFSPDGRTLASGSEDTTVRLWEVPSGAPIRTLTGHTGRVLSLAFSPDGKALASGSFDTSTRVWDVATGALSFQIHTTAYPVNAVAYSPDNQRLARGGGDGRVTIHEAQTGKLLHILGE